MEGVDGAVDCGSETVGGRRVVRVSGVGGWVGHWSKGVMGWRGRWSKGVVGWRGLWSRDVLG